MVLDTAVKVLGYAFILFSPARSFRAARIDFPESVDEHVQTYGSVLNLSSVYGESLFLEDVIFYLPIVFIVVWVISYVGSTRIGYILTSLGCLAAIYACCAGRMQAAFMLGCGILIVGLFQLVELGIEVVQDDVVESGYSVSSLKLSAGAQTSPWTFLRFLQSSPDSLFKFYQIAFAFPDTSALTRDTNNDVHVALPGPGGKAVQLHVPTVADVTQSSGRTQITLDDLELWLQAQGVGASWRLGLHADAQASRLATNILSFASASRRDSCSGNNIMQGFITGADSLTEDEWNKVAAHVAIFLHLDDDKDGLLTYAQAQPFLSGLLLPRKLAAAEAMTSDKEQASSTSSDEQEPEAAAEQ